MPSLTRRWLLMPLACVALLIVGARAGAQQRSPDEYYVDRTPSVAADSWLRNEFRKFRTYGRLDRAFRLIDQGRPQEARSELEQGIAIDPDNVRIRSTYLALLERLGDHQRVISEAADVLQRYPRFVPAFIYRGLAYQVLKRPTAALADFKAAAALEETDRRDRIFALGLIADLGEALNDPAEAVAALERLARDTPTFAVAFRRGVLLERMKRWAPAEDAFATALSAAGAPGERLQASRAAGFAALNAGNTAGARRHFVVAAQLNPGGYDVLQALGRLAYAQRRYSEADDWLKKAIAVRPEPAVRELRAMALRELKRYDEAAAELSHLAARASQRQDQLRLQMTTGWSYLSAGKLEDAARTFAHVLERGQNDTATRALAYTLQRIGRLEEAIPYMRDLASRTADRDTYVQLANMLVEAGEAASAVDSLTHAAAADGDPHVKAEVHRQLGYLYYQLGRYQDADAAFVAALRHGGEDATVLTALAEIAMRTSNRPRAVDVLARALGADPDAAMRFRIGMALIEAGADGQALGVFQHLLATRDERVSRADVSLAIARLHSRRGEIVAAADAYARALQEGGTLDAQALAEGGEALIAARRWREAAVVNQRVLAIADLPDTARTMSLVREGYIRSALGQDGAAVEAFDAALAAGSNDWEVHQALGVLLAKQQQWARAVEELGQVVADHPNTRARLYLAEAYQALGKPGLAVGHLRDAAAAGSDLDPAERAHVDRALADLYAAQGEYDAAIDALLQAQAIDPTTHAALQLGRLQRLAGHLAESRTTLAAIAPSGLPPADQRTLFQEQAATYGADGETNKAIDILVKDLAIDAGDDQFYQLGLLCQQANRLAEAIRFLSSATHGQPENQQYLLALAYAYKTAGRHGDAERTFERVIALDPRNPALYEELAYVSMNQGKTAQAVKWIDKGLAELSVPADSTAAVSDPMQSLQRLRREASGSARRFAAAVYTGTSGVASQGIPVTPFTTAARTVTQSGAEVSFAMTTRDAPVAVEAFGRLLSSTFSDRPAFSLDSGQAGVGVRLKPVRSQSLFISGERLLKVKEQWADGWLLRGAYSWNLDPARQPERSLLNYSMVYAETARYLTHTAATIYYTESRQGLSFRPAPRMVVSPHVSIEGSLVQEQALTRWYATAGPGVSFQLFFAGARRANVETVVRYRGADWGGLRASAETSAPRSRSDNVIWAAWLHF